MDSMEESRISIGENSHQLLENYNVALRELDSKNQQLHDLQRKLKESEMLRLNEVELLQAELDSNDIKKLNAQIVQLKETILEVRLGSAGTINGLELEVLNKDQEISDLQSEIKELKSKNNVSTFSVDESTSCDELYSLRQENEALQSVIDKLKEDLEKNQELISQSEINLNKCQQELAETKQCLDVKKEQLTEALALIEKLNDDLRCANSELDSLKTKPLDQESKGNSLFAEVDDRRVYLQKKIDDMKSDYILLKKERCEYLKQVAHLRTEIASLTEKYKNDLKEIEIDKYEIDQAVKERLNILEQMVETNKTEYKTSNSNDDPFERMTMFQSFIERKDKEIAELKEKLSSQALNQVLLSTSLAQANQEKRKWKMEACLRRNEEVLKDVNDSLKVTDNKPKWKQVEKGPNLPDHSTEVKQSEKVNLDLNTRHKLFLKQKNVLKTTPKIGVLEENPSQITIKSEIKKGPLEDDNYTYSTTNNGQGNIHQVKNEIELQDTSNITTRRTTSHGIIKKSSVLSESLKENLNTIENNEVVKENEKPVRSVTFTGTLPSDDNNKSKPRRIPGKVIISKPVFINTSKN